MPTPYPLPALVDGLHRLVAEVEGPEDGRALDVLAALCVAASDLRSRGGLTCGTVGRRRVEPCAGIADALEELRHLDRYNVDLAYGAIVRSLVAFERGLTDLGLVDAEGTLDVQAVWPSVTGLVGVLRWWMRPRSLWSQVLEVDERGTRRAIYGLPPQRLLRRIGFDWDQADDFAEPCDCDLGAPDPFATRVARVRDRSIHLDGGLQVRLHPLDERLWPWFHLVQGSEGLLVDVHPDRYNDPAGVEVGLQEAIRRARAAAEPQLIVFPELMVDLAARVGVQRAVREGGAPVLALFAGSAHVTLAGARRASQALVLDGAGVPWWAHHKRGSYRCVGRSILEARRLERMFKPQEVQVDPAADYHEAFAAGTSLRFCDSALGRLVVVICADLLDGAAWDDAIRRLEPDFLVVVSMSDRAGRFLERAKMLAEDRRISTLYVNAACEARVVEGAGSPPDRDVLAFAHLAIDERPGFPSRVCWRLGRGPEQWCRHRESWVPAHGDGVGVEAGGLWLDLGGLLSK